MSFYVSTATFFLLHCDEWDRVVALPRHKFVTGATLLQLTQHVQKICWHFVVLLFFYYFISIYKCYITECLYTQMLHNKYYKPWVFTFFRYPICGSPLFFFFFLFNSSLLWDVFIINSVEQLQTLPKTQSEIDISPFLKIQKPTRVVQHCL